MNQIFAAQNRELRIASFPESQAQNRQKFRSEKQKKSRIAVKGNCGKSIQNRHPNHILAMLKPTSESHDSKRTILNHSILNAESPIRYHVNWWQSKILHRFPGNNLNTA